LGKTRKTLGPDEIRKEGMTLWYLPEWQVVTATIKDKTELIPRDNIGVMEPFDREEMGIPKACFNWQMPKQDQEPVPSIKPGYLPGGRVQVESGLNTEGLDALNRSGPKVSDGSGGWVPPEQALTGDSEDPVPVLDLAAKKEEKEKPVRLDKEEKSNKSKDKKKGK